MALNNIFLEISLICRFPQDIFHHLPDSGLLSGNFLTKNPLLIHPTQEMNLGLGPHAQQARLRPLNQISSQIVKWKYLGINVRLIFCDFQGFRTLLLRFHCLSVCLSVTCFSWTVIVRYLAEIFTDNVFLEWVCTTIVFLCESDSHLVGFFRCLLTI